MPKFVWILVIGAGVTYLVNRYSKMFAYLAGATTAFLAYMSYKQGG